MALALGNLNPDTNIDVVTANASGRYASQNGFGSGGFSIATADIGGNGPRDVALADFNGDGKLDLAVANSNSNDVTVALGQNSFSIPFGAPVEYPAGSAPVSVAVGDFNGDGKVDLVTANARGNNISLLLGLGTGAFQAPVNYSLGVSPRSVEVGDFNGDGKLDLVTANSTDNSISVLFNTGIGTSTGTDTFVGAGRYGVGAFPASLAVGDFNRDGKLDLLTGR